jgi:hypothetical protein
MCSHLFDRLKLQFNRTVYESCECIPKSIHDKITPTESSRLSNKCKKGKTITPMYPKINSSSIGLSQKRDATFSLYDRFGVIDTTNRFIDIVSLRPPPPSQLQVPPYRDHNEPRSRIPPCNGITTKRWDTS